MAGHSILRKEMLLKTTRQFDVGSIHSLTFENSGIYDLGCIGECTGLIRLELPGNNISKLTTLRPLKELEILNVSRNRISSLVGVETLEKLRILNISGNLISSVDSLYPLTKCGNLEYLRLEDATENTKNPVCDSDTNYREKAFEMLPSLKFLDGLFQGKEGLEFSRLCREFMDMFQGIESKLDLSTYNLQESKTPLNCQDLSTDITSESGSINKALKLCEDGFADFLIADQNARRSLGISD